MQIVCGTFPHFLAVKTFKSRTRDSFRLEEQKGREEREGRRMKAGEGKAGLATFG